jgi:hypothetical protein
VEGRAGKISPTILAAATVMVLMSIVILTSLELLRRRRDRLRGIHSITTDFRQATTSIGGVVRLVNNLRR